MSKFENEDYRFCLYIVIITQDSNRKGYTVTPKAKQIVDKVKADAVKIEKDPEFQKIRAEMKENLRKTGRIDPDLFAKALGAKPFSEADENTKHRFNAMRGPF